ncbi:MAG: hypothetical protein WEC59_09850 [Salibacteraceae bacterium]
MRLLLAFLFVLSASLSFAGNIVLEGNYQGKNLYVRNPFAGSGVGFCTYEVTVNGSVTTDEWNSSAFEIDLSIHNLDLGEQVVVVVKHKDDCAPKVLNPEVLNPKSTFETENIAVTNDGVLKWSTKNEAGILTYVVEQFRWNKWVYVGEVEGAGRTGNINSYSFKITPHSGENKFRVKQVDYTGVPRYSPTASFMSDKSAVDFNPKKVEDNITFTAETMYEVFDIHGNIVKKGYSSKLDATNLKKGLYYLNYDNSTSEFMKKK